MAGRTWSTSRRLEFIDFRLYWQGRINRRDLREMFTISAPQAANDLRAYQEAAPGNAVYDRRIKTYLAGESFRPRFFRPDAAEYFEHLRRSRRRDERSGQAWVAADVPFAVSPIVKRRMDPEIVRSVMLAIRRKQCLRVHYQSMTRARPRVRIISPHAVASDEFRWHARAYSHERAAYRDFVLARILKATVANEPYVDGSHDHAWHETVTVRLSTNPDLEPAQRRAYEFDLGMTDGALGVPVRRALLHYFLTEMRLDFDPAGEKPPRVTPLVVVNVEEIRASLSPDRAATESRTDVAEGHGSGGRCD